MALECGFDAGFGVGTKPSEVASYIVDEYLRRHEASKREAASEEIRRSRRTAKKKRKAA